MPTTSTKLQTLVEAYFNTINYSKDMVGLVNNITDFDPNLTVVAEGKDKNNGGEPGGKTNLFFPLLEEGNEKSYSESELSKLTTIVKLLHLKRLHRLINRSFDDFLSLLRDTIPNGKLILPSSFSSAKLYVRSLGLHYEKYGVSEKPCTLYSGESQAKVMENHIDAKFFACPKETLKSIMETH